MKIEVKTVNDMGSGYCVVYPDEGPSFGVLFNNLPIDDETAFNDALDNLAEEAAIRQAPAVPKPIAPQIIARVGQKRDVVKRQDQVARPPKP
jgi:hypothetical protein